jgi:hypothetical protein
VALRTKLILLGAMFVTTAALILLSRLGEGVQQGAGQQVPAARPPEKAQDAVVKEPPEQARPTMEITYTFDASDPRKLVGYSDAVFTATVLARVGDKPLKTTIPDDPGQPQAQYEVRITNVVKSGKGPAAVGADQRATVNQMGGTDPKTGQEIAVVPGGASVGSSPDQPLKTGAEYLLATHYNTTQHWHDISAQPFGDIPLTSKTERQRLLAAFHAAHENETDSLEQ